MNRKRWPELLAPAPGMAGLRAALAAGADAVYFGAGKLNMRAGAKNFTPAQLERVVGTCHEKGVRAYLTVNTLVFGKELDRISRLLEKARKAGIDAVILWDMAVLKRARELGLTIHLSTQASVANAVAARFYGQQGVRRVVLARECTLSQVRQISMQTDLEIETFAHGALCVSLSGRCFMSQSLFKRSANRGDCAQPCRREYLIKDKESGRHLVLGDSYILSAKDLCTLPFLDRLIRAGVQGLKIEGRNRSPEYVKTVTSVYAEALCDLKGQRLGKDRIAGYLKRLRTVYNRGFSTGFYLGMPTGEDYSKSHGSMATTRKTYLGRVENYFKKPRVAEVILHTGCIKKGDSILVIGNKTGVKEERVVSIHVNGEEVQKAIKGQSAGIRLHTLVRKNDEVYRIIPVKTN